MYDVCIIGAGVLGCSIARELSRYDIKVCLLEKAGDVCEGASKANSGIVHGGFAEKPGKLKAELCVKGNRMYAQLEKELNFGYRETGSMVIGFNDEDKAQIETLYEYGKKNGVGGLEILPGDRVRQMEPHINPDVKFALYCKDSGVTSPYEFTIALAENAVENGVELKLENEVLDIRKEQDHFRVVTNRVFVLARYVINAAGVYSDRIASLAGTDDFTIIPRRGQYIVLDKIQGKLVNSVIFQVPTKEGKGILVTMTYHGNLMLGPNAEEIDEKDNVGTTEDALKYIIKTARKSIPDFDIRNAITTFSGIRPTNNSGDFIIGESSINGFINAAGVDSPGLTSSPAIALKVVDILDNAGLKLKLKRDFNPFRPPIFKRKDSNFKGKIDSDIPEENIICRCELVTEAEIVDALHRAIPIRSTEAIKRRTRAGMGRCQGAFCGPRVKALIAKELGITEEEVLLRSKNTAEILERVKKSLIKDLQ